MTKVNVLLPNGETEILEADDFMVVNGSLCIYKKIAGKVRQIAIYNKDQWNDCKLEELNEKSKL
jgi:hypothetical protein